MQCLINFVLIFGLKLSLFGSVVSMTVTNLIIFAVNEFFLTRRFKLDFEDEDVKLLNFGQTKVLFWNYWRQAWPSIVLNLINTGLLFCLFVKSGEITVKDALPAISILIFLNDIFIQLSKGYEQSLCSFIGFYLGSEATATHAQRHRKIFLHQLYLLILFKFVIFTLLVVFLPSSQITSPVSLILHFLCLSLYLTLTMLTGLFRSLVSLRDVLIEYIAILIIITLPAMFCLPLLAADAKAKGVLPFVGYAIGQAVLIVTLWQLFGDEVKAGVEWNEKIKEIKKEVRQEVANVRQQRE